MSSLRRSLLVALAAAALAAAADQNLMNLVMPDAAALSGVNVSKIMSSPFGRFLASQMPTADADFLKFVTATGFDPRYDVQEILIGVASSKTEGRGLLLARGTFDTAKILAAAKLQGMTTKKYKGADVVAVGSGDSKLSPQLGGKPGGEGWFTLLDSATAVFGDAASVRSVLDHRGTGGGPNPKLVARAQELSSRFDFWGVSIAPVKDLAGSLPEESLGGPMKDSPLQSIVETSGGIKFGSNIEILGEAVTRSEKDAAALADVVRFLAGLVQLNQQNAKITGPAKLLESMELTTQGNAMRISWSIPEAEVETLLLSAKQQAQASGQGMRTGRQPQASTSPARPPAPAPKPPGDLVIQSSPKDMGTVTIKPQ